MPAARILRRTPHGDTKRNGRLALGSKRSLWSVHTRVIQAILDNPIAIREWRVLRRRAGDWRIWVGVRWPLDPIVWGAPVILTYSVAPYGLWAMLACLLAALGWAAATVYSRSAPFPNNPFQVAGMQMFSGGVVIFLFSLVSGDAARSRWLRQTRPRR